MTISEGRAIDYHSTVRGGGSWQCANPKSRTFLITVTAAGFSNTWNAKLSADGLLSGCGTPRVFRKALTCFAPQSIVETIRPQAGEPENDKST